MKKNIIIAGALLAALLFAGCSDVFNPPKLETSGTGGQLVVQIDGGARTLAPTNLTDLTYKLIIIRSGSLTEVAYSGPVTPLEVVAYTLETGSWNVTAEAYKDDTLVANRSVSVTIVKGETQNVSLTLIPVNNQDVPGTFNFDITYPSLVIVDSSSLTLVPANPNEGFFSVDMPQEAGETNLSGTQELPAGEYTMTLNLVSSRIAHDKPLTVSRIEKVYIYPGLETPYTVTFTEADFTANMVIAGYISFVDVSEYPITSYIPTKAYFYEYGAYGQNNAYGSEIEIVDITSSGYYEFELESHKFYSDQPNAYIRFEAENNGKILNTGAQAVPIKGIQGTFDGSTQMTVIPLNNIVLPGMGGVVAVNGNEALITDIVRTGTAQVKITPPDNYGLIKNTLKLNGEEPASFPSAIDETIIANFYEVGAGKNEVTLDGDFFHLEGTIALTYNTEGYRPVKIEAFEGTKCIGSYTIPDYTQYNEWLIPIPKGYMWESSNTNVRLVTTLAAQGLNNEIRENTVDITTLTTDTDKANITIVVSIPLNAPASFDVTETNTSNSYLSSVTLAWSAVTNASGYIIERSIDDGAWEIITETEAWMTSYTDYEVPPVNAEIDYRVTAKGTGLYTNSNPTQLAVSVTTPTAEIINYNQLYYRSIDNSKEKKVFLLNTGVASINIYLSDSYSYNNNGYGIGDETLDVEARLYTYNANNAGYISSLGYIDSANGNGYITNNNPILIVVNAYAYGDGIGSFNLRVDSNY